VYPAGQLKLGMYLLIEMSSEAPFWQEIEIRRLVFQR
jgi:hypothetical protein